MPEIVTDATEADGTLVESVVDAVSSVLLRYRIRTFEEQPASVRRRDEARLAMTDWQLLRELHDVLTAGGQAYWNTVAPDAGLPATAGAYSTALTFLSGRRDKAMSRALAALNRWRLA